MTTTEHPSFPSDETLAAYIDGRLDEEKRRQVAEHMADCAECLETLLIHGELNARGELDADLVLNVSPVAVHPSSWRYASIGLAAAAVVAVVFLVPSVRDRIFPPDDMRALAKVAPPQRLSDGRVTGFPHRPRAARQRSGGDDSDAAFDSASPKFKSVFIDVLERAEEHPSVRTLHAAGVADLVINKKTDALANLQRALLEETHQSDVELAIAKSADAPLLSDLAAAYVADGRHKEQASAAAERAWQLSKTPEIAWNRALAAEAAESPAAALAKWNQYLQLEPKSDWAGEAQTHIGDLLEQISNQ